MEVLPLVEELWQLQVWAVAVVDEVQIVDEELVGQGVESGHGLDGLNWPRFVWIRFKL